MDYDPAVVSDILDFPFKPNWGLNLDILKVEMGARVNAANLFECMRPHCCCAVGG